MSNLITDLRSRINPIYATTLGTESYERQLCVEEIERLTDEVNQQASQIEALRGFAQEIMDVWPDCYGIDGGDLQDIAAEHGLLKTETRTEPCGENCACAEYGDFPATCYRKTELLTGK